MKRGMISVGSLGPDAQRQVAAAFSLRRDMIAASEAPKPSKYRNHKTAYKSRQGFERTYDSKREAAFAAELDLDPAVKWWLPQVRIPLPGGVTYVVDFVVFGCGQIPITPIAWPFVSFVDVKGKDTQASINKRKQVKAMYGIDVKVIK